MKSFLYFSLLFLAIGCGRDLSLDNGDNLQVFDEPAVKEPDSIDLVEEEKSQFDAVTTFEINPENFVDSVTNPYFSIVPGRKFHFDGRSLEGATIHKELLASDHTQKIQGVNTYAVWEREWENDSLIRDTKKWYAQDKEGNVWLFGEDDLEIFGGLMKGTGISWKAGVGEAKAGIVMPKEPKVADEINREFNGYVEYKADILAVGESIQVPYGELSDCVKIRNYQIANNQEQHQYYCKDVGNLAWELFPEAPGQIRLSKIEDNFPTEGISKSYPKFEPAINEDQAKKIAFEEVVDGLSVSSVSLTLWKNKPTYEVEVLKEEDKKAMVYIDVQNGKVLKVVD